MALSSGPNLGLLVNGDIGEAHYDELMRAWRGVDALIQCHVLDKDLNDPPVTPADGNVYIVGGTPTGGWATHATELARWNELGTAWEFYTPKEGWHVYVTDENMEYTFDGTAWVPSHQVAAYNTVTALTSTAGVVNIDLSLGDFFTLTPTENITSITFSNLPGAGKGSSIMLEITQGATPRTITWPASFKWSGAAGVVSTTANAVDVLALTSFNNGTAWRATLAKGFA